MYAARWSCTAVIFVEIVAVVVLGLVEEREVTSGLRGLCAA